MLAQEFSHQSDDFEPVDASDWTRDRYVDVGIMALRAVEEVQGVEQPVTKEMLRRLFVLGLSPGPQAFFRGKQPRFDSMREFRQEIGAGTIKGAAGHLFDDWSVGDFVSSAAQISAQVQRRPRHQDYAAFAGTRDPVGNFFPGEWVINSRFGGVAALNELLGYPDVRSWDIDDYIEYGVRVAEVNGPD